jgi:CPA1 family monovalent cation:H+ antiporter
MHVHTADSVLIVVALTLAAAFGARHVRTPLPVVLAAVGIVAGLLWQRVIGLPRLFVPPESVLFVFLPPLLTSAAYSLPLGAMRRNLSAIVMLAVGLVMATMVTAAAMAHALAGLAWPAAFILGAIIAPPDPVAATSVAERTGLAHRFVTILEGEGLVNDALAIVAYRVAVQAVTNSAAITWEYVGVSLLREVPIGIGVGVVVGWIATEARRRIDDVTLEAGLSIFSPYLIYEISERLGGSSVLAVVTFGFLLQYRADSISVPAVRLAALTIWNAIDFVSTALVFVLLGLLLGEVSAETFSTAMILPATAVAGAVIGLRLLWMYAVPEFTRVAGFGRRAAAPTWRERTVLGWAGMRGVVSLALALALPGFAPAHGGAVARTTIILLSFGVIVATLVVQGFTLLPLINVLGVGDPGRDERDETRIRRQAQRAGLAGAQRWARSCGLSRAACARLASAMRSGRIGIASPRENAEGEIPFAAFEAALEAQRRLVHESHGADRIGASLADRLKTELDVDTVRLRGDAARLTTETS